MTVFQALVLGILQGLAEFLPISSSAHLALAPWVFGWPEPGLAVDVALHVGTLVAVLVYFREEWIKLIVAALEIVRTQRIQTPEQKRVVFLLVATIPGGIAGVFLNDYAESTFRSPALIAVALAAMGIVLWLVDRVRPQTRSLDAIRWSDAILIGIAQAAALLPGVSRSGATITAGRALALDRESAATFSFLMSMPIIAAAAIFKVPHLLHSGGASLPLLVGITASAVSGWLAIAIVMRYVRSHSYGVFAVYRVLLGAAVLALFFVRARG
ncbi:MAG TPA: undecaprenyl-diphosphate phosphatase [Gemmatimonadaceae bacterium]|nr:undecaprenyl-diphosphate phosphatase [Gemmatimonadaceae bacterium]